MKDMLCNVSVQFFRVVVKVVFRYRRSTRQRNDASKSS
jgi:hypothetical protein